MPSDTTKDNADSSKAVDLASQGKRLLSYLLDSITGRGNESFKRAVLFLLTAFILSFLILPSRHFLVTKYSEGDIASTDIKANQSYLLEDRLLTEKKRAEAEQAVPRVYDLVASQGDEIKKSFAKAFALIIDARAKGDGDIEALRGSVAEVLGIDVTGQELESLLKVRNYRPLLAEIGHLTEVTYRRMLVADKAAFDADRNRGIILLDSASGRMIGAGDHSITVTDKAELAQSMKNRKLPGVPLYDSNVLKGLLLKALRPNLKLNSAATEVKQKEARNAVRPVVYQIKRGEMVVREGERITEEQAIKLNKIFEVGSGMKRFLTGLGIFGLVLALSFFSYRFGIKNIRKFRPAGKDLFLIAVVTIFFFALLKGLLVFSTAMGILLPKIGIDDYFYLFPFAAGAMLVRIILNSEVALVYCAICAPLLGIMFGNSIPVVIYALLSSIIGAHGVRQCQYRGTIYSAGLKVSVVNLALALPLQVFSDNFFTSQSLYIIIFALIGGVGNAIIVAGTVPVIENVFHYTTDIKLLELASFNSPVLRELMIRAPGSYHHSILVGTMVEAAAEAIHANPLLARVAAYYHDIGKSSKPLYFIENTTGGENRHDKLSPSMSALILISHVKEGAEMAREKRLGRPIIDIIRQHHGTALISYFYQKAKTADDPEARNVDERDFRYPGPKPQTREAGLVMLADCVEAASKTLSDPTPARIQGMVQKIINNIFIDGQLDECELTLKNLHDIAKSFNRILAGIYHHRIDYPEPAFKVNGRKKPVEDIDREQAKTASHRVEEGKKGSGEDLKRLGIHR
ncbi:MAG: HDIG domain-containing protein [Geobacteraceae bacterium]|nr:HDIG domain-containing protein [Geobacteraceae bacterium]